MVQTSLLLPHLSFSPIQEPSTGGSCSLDYIWDIERCYHLAPVVSERRYITYSK